MQPPGYVLLLGLAELINSKINAQEGRDKAAIMRYAFFLRKTILLCYLNITENFYTCTDEILSGLGKMYVYDERFTENIDKHAKGTSSFISEAINAYCI